MRLKAFFVFALLAVVSSSGLAVVVTLTDETQTTTFTANVTEQADVSVPASIAWTVDDVSIATESAAQSVSASTIVLEEGKALRVEIKADAANFTAATGGAVTWAASDVSWNSPAWTGGTGATGSLSTDYAKVADSTANISTLSTDSLVFTLAAKSTVDRAGAHTLVATWKFSSFTPTP